MAEKHDPNQLVGAAPDIAPLAWVIDEIRNSLTDAVNGLKAFVANKQDVDSVRNARNQIHQANGALQLLDLRGVALVTEAIEHLTRRFEADPKECSPAPIRTIETALSAVIAYLEGLLSGRPNQPIKLYPYYRDVLQLDQANRVHPADLVFPDLSRRPAFHQIEARNFTPRQLRDRARGSGWGWSASCATRTTRRRANGCAKRCRISSTCHSADWRAVSGGLRAGYWRRSRPAQWQSMSI